MNIPDNANRDEYIKFGWKIVGIAILFILGFDRLATKWYNHVKVVTYTWSGHS